MRGTYILISRKEIEYDEIYLHIKTDITITYYTKYRVQTGTKELAIWTQWFDKPFNIKRFTLAD